MPRKKSIKKTKSKAKDMHPKSEPKKQKPMKKETKKKQESFDIIDTSSITFWKATTVVFALLFLVSIFTHGFSFTSPATTGMPTAKVTVPDTGNPTSSASAATTPADNAVKLDFYLMSQCPFGTQVADAIEPVIKKLGSSVDFNMYFIADDNGDGTFSSLHGQPEVDGDIVQLCAAKHNPDKYMDMIVCQNKNAGAIPGNWEQCAKDSGLDAEKIKACFEGGEGKELMSASIKASREVGATGSPTIYLNDEPYAGGRTENDFLRAICNAYEGTKPDACNDIPACSTDFDCTAEPDKIGKCINPNEKDALCEYTDPVTVVVTVLNDERCTTCDTSRINQVTKNFFKGVEFKEVDYSTKEGKELYETYAIQYLPSFIFDNNIEKTATWTTNAGIQSSFKKNDDGTYMLRYEATGSSWDPAAEICDNEIDDNADGKIDCDDATCASKLICNKDAIVECAKPHNITSDTIIFLHSNGCGWCKKMIPGVEALQKEGYKFHWAEGSDAESMEVIEDCISEYMTGSGVPQFICMKNADIHVGAFTDENRNLDVDGLRKFADDCIAS